MTKYEVLIQAAKDARKEWNRRNEAVKHVVNDLLQKFTAYCEIPIENIGLLPWDEGSQTFQGSAGKIYGMFQALSFDEEQDEWRIGVVVYLSPKNVVPRAYAAFGVFITFEKSIPVMRVADKQIKELDNPFEANEFFDFLVKTLRDSFTQSKSARKRYGFDVSLPD